MISQALPRILSFRNYAPRCGNGRVEEVSMQISNRAVAWALGILAVVLVVIPLLGMIAMMGMGTLMGGMTGMHTAGVVWVLLAVVVVIALVIVLLRGATKM